MWKPPGHHQRQAQCRVQAVFLLNWANKWCPKKDSASFVQKPISQALKDRFGILRLLLSTRYTPHLWTNRVASITPSKPEKLASEPYRAYFVGHPLQPFHWLKETPWANLSSGTGWSCWTSRRSRSNLLFSRTTPTALWRILNGKLSTTKVWQYELIKMHNVQDCIYFICSWKSQKIVHWCQNSRARSLASEAKWSVSITISILSCYRYFLL